ncbi:hypothetical protein SISNIDRAFT_489241 [Sistotremastrum niveocremeum HHB9708]|uniref:Uncharacterized protein n=1 Tax=Sistotremastrum niveocremeum HHB9708 TaxID=1314777 RepID=A0A164QDG7_9AGAM|nr:hypothetical protein SISNIDRAFT_489241 [Sistotremastrum niveocremeum HHB9708]
MPHDPRNNYVRLADASCRIVPKSLIDFTPRREVSGSQQEIVKVINSLCFRNELSVTMKLEDKLFAGDPQAQRAHGRATHTWLFLSKVITDVRYIRAQPITIWVWDTLSDAELNRPVFRECTHVLRIFSSLPSIHPHSPSGWIASLVVTGVLKMRNFDPQVEVLNISFACTTAQACVCLALKGEGTLARHRKMLSECIDRGTEKSWRKEDNALFICDRRYAEKITYSHVAECIAATMGNLEANSRVWSGHEILPADLHRNAEAGELKRLPSYFIQVQTFTALVMDRKMKARFHAVPAFTKNKNPSEPSQCGRHATSSIGWTKTQISGDQINIKLESTLGGFEGEKDKGDNHDEEYDEEEELEIGP